jgi:hypothetical protein
MHTLIKLIIVAPLLLAGPVAGQDILGPIEDFVESLTGPPTPRRPAPKAEPLVAPVPRPRPPNLPDVPDVEGTEGPVAEEPVEAEPEMPVEPAPVEPEPDEEVAPPPEAEPEPVTPEPEVVAEPEPTEPERVYQVACPAVLAGLVEAEMAPPLSEGICGEQSPLIVTGVLVRGRMLPLSSPITTNCQMASALPDWAETVDGYASSVLESPLATINTGTSYMCRNRNNAENGFTSEHGFANAVDVTGFTLEDGRTIGVEGNWLPATNPEGRLLRLAHDAACGDFTTVLGPEANAEHNDHLHLDLGCHGRSCTARMCE